MFLLDRERAAVTLWERGNKQAGSALPTQIVSRVYWGGTQISCLFCVTRL